MKNYLDSASGIEKFSFYFLVGVAGIHFVALIFLFVPEAIRATNSETRWAVASVFSSPAIYWGMALYCINHPRWWAWFFASTVWFGASFYYSLYLVFEKAGAFS